MRSIFPVTGYTVDEQFSFYGNDQYEFTFMQNKPVFSTSNTIEPKDGFIRCMTHQGHQVAVYCGGPLHLSSVQTLNTSCFMISNGMVDEEIDCFNEIIFEGGTLNQLFFPRKASLEPEQEKFSVQVSPDVIEFHFLVKADTYCDAKVESSIGWSIGSDGTELHNKDVRFTMTLDKKMPLSFCFDCYNALLHCMRFMTNRQNVDVASITLHALEDGRKHYECGMFDVYIKRTKEMTEKDRFHNILFEDLGDTFSKLIEMYFFSTDGKSLYSLGFFPANDREVYIVDNDTIRSICSALEFEADQEPAVQPEQNPELDNLICEAKRFIKVYRKGHDGISSSTYDRIFTGMKHWSFSARDKIEKLWGLHQAEMLTIQRMYGDVEPKIGEFVKYRNKITHGAESVIPIEVGRTALMLRGLVYCCVMRRIGVGAEKLDGMMKYRRINS